jgi:hypothetical protein
MSYNEGFVVRSARPIRVKNVDNMNEGFGNGIRKWAYVMDEGII